MTANKIIISSILLIASCGSATALPSDLCLGFPGEAHTSVGVYIKSLADDSVIVSNNAKIALTPASTMKALTTATAMSLLGCDFTFQTPVRIEGKRHGKHWHGDIVIESCGDPTIDSEYFAERGGFCDSIAVALQRCGINHIDGNIVIRESMPDPGPNDQWEIEDVAWPYGAGLFGLNYKDNTVKLHPITGVMEPFVPNLKVTLKRGRGNNLKRGVESDNLIVTCRNMKNKKWCINTTMPYPAAVVEYALRGKLAEYDIAIGGKDITFDNDSTASTIYSHLSAPSAEIYRSLMHRSDNLFAEGILHAITPQCHIDSAITIEKNLWRERGISDISDMLIYDGSGLTRGNKLAPKVLGDILEWMAHSCYAENYVSYFPKAGIDGTMKSFGSDTPLSGTIALKTGSVRAVQCYAGYKLDDKGMPTHVVVVMVEGFSCQRAKVKKAIEDFLLSTLYNS